MIRFVEVVEAPDQRAGRYALSEVWINGEYVVNLREGTRYKKLLKEGQLPSDLDAHHEFTTITVNNGNMSEAHVVLGDVSFVAGRLGRSSRTLLKG
mgnify:CR=1 FL=1